MHVSLVLPTLEVGGQERLVVSLARGLRQFGVQAEVIGLVGGGPLEAELRDAHVRHVVLTPAHRIPGYPAALLAYLRSNPTQLLHSHSGSWFPAAVAGRRLGIPVLHAEHGRYPNEPWWARAADVVASLCTTRIVVVSDRLQDEMRRRLYLRTPPDLVPNGVEVPQLVDPETRTRLMASLGLTPDACVVGTVGRLVPAKDHALLIAAMALLFPRMPRLQCVIIGGGPLRGALEAQARAAGVDGRIRFLGERPDASALVAAFDAFVLSSSTEGTPLAVLEAMAAGCPVVATAVGGLPALLGTGAGVLVPHGDEHALAGAIEAVLQRPGESRRMGAAARELVQASYSVRRCAERYAGIYRSLLRA